MHMDPFRGLWGGSRHQDFRGQTLLRLTTGTLAKLSGYASRNSEVIRRHLGQVWAALLNSEQQPGGAKAPGHLQGAMGKQWIPKFQGAASSEGPGSSFCEVA